MILGLKTCGFLQKIKVFYSIAVSSLSTYIYTPSGRRTTISALNPFAPRLFWENYSSPSSSVGLGSTRTVSFVTHSLCICATITKRFS